MMYCNILVDLTIYNVNYATIDLETAYYSSLCEHIVMNFEKRKGSQDVITMSFPQTDNS